MSKSLGKGSTPTRSALASGRRRRPAPVARLRRHFSVDVPCDETILGHVGDAYRKIRNTLRFLLGELEGQFDPATDGLAFDDLEANDKVTLAHVRGA